MSSKSINTVLFDLAGVLVPTLADGHFAEVESSHGLEPNSILICWMDAELRRLYTQVECGVVSCAEFETVFMHHYREKFDLPDQSSFSPFLSAEQCYTKDDKLYPEMRSLILMLKDLGYKTALVTNNYWLDESRKRTGMHIEYGLFDSVSESCRVGCRKPDVKLVEHALTTLKKHPSECVMLDDSQNNLTCAQKLGMRSVWVNSMPDGITKLAKVLKEPRLLEVLSAE